MSEILSLTQPRWWDRVYLLVRDTVYSCINSFPTIDDRLHYINVENVVGILSERL